VEKILDNRMDLSKKVDSEIEVRDINVKRHYGNLSKFHNGEKRAFSSC
jgi:hypothetical protein